MVCHQTFEIWQVVISKCVWDGDVLLGMSIRCCHEIFQPSIVRCMYVPSQVGTHHLLCLFRVEVRRKNPVSGLG
jgi:hypothetical protein